MRNIRINKINDLERNLRDESYSGLVELVRQWILVPEIGGSSPSPRTKNSRSIDDGS